MTTLVRKIWLDRTTREALREHAWINRTSMGVVVRAALIGVRDDPGDVSALSSNDTMSEVQLSIKVDDELWEAARRAAATTDMSFTSLVRRRIIKLLTEEGYLK